MPLIKETFRVNQTNKFSVYLIKLIMIFLALRNLGLCYENGIGCRKNSSLAFQLYDCANEAGDTPGIFQIF